MTRAESMLENAPPQADTPVSAPRPDKRVPWYDRAKFSLVRWFLGAWVAIFSLRGLYLFGRWFGFIEYVINFKRRARYRRELEGVFPEGLTKARERKIICDYFLRTRCDKLFYLIFDRLPRDRSCAASASTAGSIWMTPWHASTASTSCSVTTARTTSPAC